MNNKGQVSIEFILLIVIAMVYIYGTVRPLINDATTAAEDVQRVSDTKISAQKLANAINEAAAGSGESKRTIHLLVPKGVEGGLRGTRIECDSPNNKINYIVEISTLHERNPMQESANIGCTPQTDPLDSLKILYYECKSSITCLSGAVPGNCPAMIGPLFKAFAVTRDASGVVQVVE